MRPGQLVAYSALTAAAFFVAGSSAGGASSISAAKPAVAHRCQAAPDGIPHAAFSAVAALSAGNAWAVGSIHSARTLIVHWNGRTWTRQPSPSPGGKHGLAVGLVDVAAVSAGDAWAVGYADGSSTLILRWNGTGWARVPSPKSAHDGVLLSVAVTSARDAWAAGRDPHNRAMILHWDGTAWKRVPSPSPKGYTFLSAIAASARSDAWAVGYHAPPTFSNTQTLILHWNGHRWTRVDSPASAKGSALFAVSTTSDGNAWAVGQTGFNIVGSKPTPLILHWNGTRWKEGHGPALPNGGVLLGITSSPGRALAVGNTSSTYNPNRYGLILRWNGTGWARVPGLPHAQLADVSGTSPCRAWAVGYTPQPHDQIRSLILRWNGNDWR